jgi:hypothetical protein
MEVAGHRFAETHEYDRDREEEEDIEAASTSDTAPLLALPAFMPGAASSPLTSNQSSSASGAISSGTISLIFLFQNDCRMNLKSIFLAPKRGIE